MNIFIALVCNHFLSAVFLSDLPTGRTARIGNVGLATSFYNDKDEGLAEALVKVLLETDQPVPDFLQASVPQDGKVEWDDDTDNEGEDVEEGAEGAGTNGKNGTAPAAEDATW
jgi:ATP-dependent RNA helicase DDX3X